jgi:hypothetical protein
MRLRSLRWTLWVWWCWLTGRCIHNCKSIYGVGTHDAYAVCNDCGAVVWRARPRP